MNWPQNPFNKMPTPKTESAELKQTDPATLKLLEEKARAIANTAASQEQFTDAEIHQMAIILAKHAEGQGEPLDEEIISSPSFESRIIDALDARNKMRGGDPKAYISEPAGPVIGQASTAAEAQRITEDQREAA